MASRAGSSRWCSQAVDARAPERAHLSVRNRGAEGSRGLDAPHGRARSGDVLIRAPRPPARRLMRWWALPGLLAFVLARLPSFFEPHWYTDEAGYSTVAR